MLQINALTLKKNGIFRIPAQRQKYCDLGLETKSFIKSFQFVL